MSDGEDPTSPVWLAHFLANQGLVIPEVTCLAPLGMRDTSVPWECSSVGKSKSSENVSECENERTLSQESRETHTMTPSQENDG